MIDEAIILAGGLGTRLRSVIPDLPKCMAPVAGKPFLYYVITHLQKEGIDHFIFALGHKSESIIEYLKNFQTDKAILKYRFSIEDEPMGTGGAICLALKNTATKNVLVCNGDTLFNININSLDKAHRQHNSDCTLSLKPMKNFDRYGVVELGSDNSVQSFNEKKSYAGGLINGGLYALNKERFLNRKLALKFSFEKDYLEKFVGENKFFAIVQDQYFIDIGIPEDYDKARHELK